MFMQLRQQLAARRQALGWQAVHWGWREFQRAGMVTAGTPAGRAFREFGRGSIMAFPAGAVYGENWITVGADTVLGAQVTISAGLVPGQDLGPDPVLRVRDRGVIRRGAHLAGRPRAAIAGDVSIGDYDCI